MVAILVSRHVPILDNGETGLMDLGSVRKIRRISGMPIAYSLVRPWPLYAYTGLIPGLLVVYTNMDLPNGPGISVRRV